MHERRGKLFWVSLSSALKAIECYVMVGPQIAYDCKIHEKLFASDLYGRLQWLAYWLTIVNAHTDLPLIFYLLLKELPIGTIII